mgnify:FL=1
MTTIDLNCDLGESFGHYKLGENTAILKYITSANIACGFHAGDPSVMRETVARCMEHQVSIGAHPGLPDLVGFGRREMAISPTEAYDLTVYQIGALHAVATSQGGTIRHVKPHGALYNMAAKNPALAEAIAKAVYDVSPNLILFGLAGSELITAGQKYGLPIANEVFADRTYTNDGILTPRSNNNAVITSDEAALAQVLQMVKTQTVNATSGETVSLQADTICLHGDGEKAVVFAKMISETLTAEGIDIKAIV